MLGPILQWINKIYQTIDSNLTHKVDADVSSRQANWGATTTHRDRIDTTISSRASHSAQDVKSAVVLGNSTHYHGGKDTAEESNVIVNYSGRGQLVGLTNSAAQEAIFVIEIDNLGSKSRMTHTVSPSSNIIVPGTVVFTSNLKITSDVSTNVSGAIVVHE